MFFTDVKLSIFFFFSNYIMLYYINVSFNLEREMKRSTLIESMRKGSSFFSSKISLIKSLIFSSLFSFKDISI